jgi:hypothetical protein
MMTMDDVRKTNGALMMIALLVLLPLFLFSGSLVAGEHFATEGSGEGQPAAVARDNEETAVSGRWLSPAAALADGKPILLLFLPYEMCQIRYCPQPELVAERLAQQGGDDVNFVPVTVYAVPAADAGAVPLGYRLENWDLYPVPPYDAWLPRPQETPFGLGLQAPVYTLVNGRGTVVSQGRGFRCRPAGACRVTRCSGQCWETQIEQC